jgi:hypothetical protein
MDYDDCTTACESYNLFTNLQIVILAPLLLIIFSDSEWIIWLNFRQPFILYQVFVFDEKSPVLTLMPPPSRAEKEMVVDIA